MSRIEMSPIGMHIESERIRTPDISFGAFYPDPLTNEEIESWGVKTKSGKLLTAAKMSRLLGIEQRFVAKPHQDQHHMGFLAADQAIKDPQSIDKVYVTSSYPTGKNIAQSIINEFDMRADTQALDFYAACSGFASALSYIHHNPAEHEGANILFVSTEKYSNTVEDLRTEGALERDPSMAQTIFSDGAVAMQFRLGKDMTIVHSKDTALDAKFRSAIQMPIDKEKMQSATPYCTFDVKYAQRFTQNGGEVVAAVGSQVPREIDRVVWDSERTSSGIQKVITHQGSRTIVEEIDKNLQKLYLGKNYAGKFVYDLADGNFSSASIPKALKRSIEEGTIKKGDEMVLAGFGAGLFASTVLVRL